MAQHHTPGKWTVFPTSEDDRARYPGDRWTCLASDFEKLDPNSDAASIDGGAWPTMQEAFAAALQGWADEARWLNRADEPSADTKEN